MQASVISEEPQHLPAGRRERPDAQSNVNNTPAQTEPIPVTREQRNETVVHADATNDHSTLQILQRQNEISELLIKQQNASQLPPREIPLF